MTSPKVRRFSWRNNPFSEGGRVSEGGTHYAGGTLLPEPDALWNVDSSAPADLVGLPWERRTYDAWTTPEFREAVRAWLVEMLAANPWVVSWLVREKATAARLTLARLTEPVLLVAVTRKEDSRVFQASSAWTAADRDDLTRALSKLAGMRVALETEHARNPP